jgi:hypothetical protein
LPSGRHGEATGYALVASENVLAATPAMFIGTSDDVVYVRSAQVNLSTTSDGFR